jgi:hypothetical protein
MAAATANAAPDVPSETPGSSQAAAAIDAAATTHDSSSRTGRSRGRSGCQTTASP